MTPGDLIHKKIIKRLWFQETREKTNEKVDLLSAESGPTLGLNNYNVAKV